MKNKIIRNKYKVFNMKHKQIQNDVKEELLKGSEKELYIGNNISLNETYARDIFKSILDKAIIKNASDIHIEPFKEYILVRLRVDGFLVEERKIEYEVYQQLLVVIKLDTFMNITEKRLPQDGRLAIDIKDQVIDIRASTLPTVYGEKIVLRILNRKSFLKRKEELGFSKKAIDKIESIINKKSGILLVTGSTGSGKTTTVYSIINDLKCTSKNIVTIEDPVEYKIEGVNQIQVNNKLGLSFENGLRSILRQDPDIIIVGEIRDIETAKIAIKAATTGHLVISTIHTKDAVSAISRLLDMEIPQYLISASLIGIISQKLIRKVCTTCIMKKESNELNQTNENNMNSECEECDGLGYKGRTAIYEILEIDDDIRKDIQNMKDYNTIKETAIKNGMITFEESAKDLIDNNITTEEEYISLEVGI